jgi:hypothetical protein
LVVGAPAGPRLPTGVFGLGAGECALVGASGPPWPWPASGALLAPVETGGAGSCTVAVAVADVWLPPTSCTLTWTMKLLAL